MTLGFGKYADTDIEQVPERYLRSLLESNVNTIKIIESELQRREAVESADLSVAEQIVRYGIKHLRAKWHPDANHGDRKRYDEIDAAAQLLESVVLKELRAVRQR